MKKRIFLIGFIFVTVVEIIALIVFAIQTPNYSQDTVAVNEIVQSVKQDFYDLEQHKNTTALDYVILDENGNLLYKTKSGLSESINEAIGHRDTILDISISNDIVGKIIIYNDGELLLQAQKQTITIILMIAIIINSVICIVYAVYMHFTIVRPFHKLKGFARRVADGNLDVPLEMDRQNLF